MCKPHRHPQKISNTFPTRLDQAETQVIESQIALDTLQAEEATILEKGKCHPFRLFGFA